jgi:regulator of protease activity HflC (stomatin/prohibitin superfamily)
MTMTARYGSRWSWPTGVALGLLLATSCVSCLACTNPQSPAGTVGYVTKVPFFMPSRFYELQTGPTSTGLGWRLFVANVDVTQQTSTEPFVGDAAVLSKDNLRVAFQVHMIWHVNPDRVRDLVEKYQGGYASFVKEPFRTYARDEIQKYNGLDIKDNITPISDAIMARVRALTNSTPFDVTSVVVGNIQYPEEVANAVSKKLAATQTLERTQIEIDIAKKEAEKRVAEASGVARAMDIINQKLTSQYLQHEAIEAQKLMVNAPNHTTIYIPVGANGVPLVGTFNTQGEK